MIGNYIEDSMFGSKPIWHVCTPGENQCVLFRDSDDFRYGMNIVGVSAVSFKDSVDVLTFELMSNHVHFVLHGDKNDVEKFFDYFYRRLRRLFIRQERLSDLKGFTAGYHSVDTENYLRNLIAYVNRNGYVVNVNETPFSYLWGANRYIFNEASSLEEKVLINSIPKKKRDEFFHVKDLCFPDNYYLVDGYISPKCFCRTVECESLYKNAHHYFSLLSRNVESFKDIARMAGDSIIYTDEEMFSASIYFVKKNFEKQKISLLDINEKIELAKHLHFNYNASNKQLSRLLKIDDSVIRSLFPSAR